MTALPVAAEARILAADRFAREWRDADSWVRREARTRLAGGLWSAPVIEQALDNAFWMIDGESSSTWSRERADDESSTALRTLIILPGNVIGPALHAAYRVAQTGASAIVKTASQERALTEIIARQWQKSGAPLAGKLEARHWVGGDLTAESAAMSDVENVIAFGSDETVEAVRRRVPAGVRFTGHGARYSVGLVLPDADLATTAEAASVDVCMFDQAGCKSPQTIYVVGDAGRALRFAHALDGALARTGSLLPRMAATREEAAAAADVLRRARVTAIAAPSHGLSPILAGPDNNGTPDHLIVVEPQGPPRNHGFGRIVVVMPLEAGRAPVLTTEIEQIGIAGRLDGAESVSIALWPNSVNSCEPYKCALGTMQRPPLAQPFASEFFRGDDSGT